MYGISSRVSVLATGIEPERFNKISRSEARQQLDWPSDTVTVISIGRLALEKNWEVLLRSFQAVVRDEASLLRLVVIGDGEERESLEGLCVKLGIHAHVEFVGSVSPDKIPLYLAASDIFGFASTTETQGLATLEAMAAGLPIVAVDASGTSDVVTDGQEGFLAPCDHEALAAQLKKLVRNRMLRLRFGAVGRRRAESLCVTAQSSQLEEIYRTTIEDFKSGYRVLHARETDSLF